MRDAFFRIPMILVCKNQEKKIKRGVGTGGATNKNGQRVCGIVF